MAVQEVSTIEENTLLSEVIDRIAWITFNNPARMNAMSQEMWDNSAALLDNTQKMITLEPLSLEGLEIRHLWQERIFQSLAVSELPRKL